MTKYILVFLFTLFSCNVFSQSCSVENSTVINVLLAVESDTISTQHFTVTVIDNNDKIINSNITSKASSYHEVVGDSVQLVHFDKYFSVVIVVGSRAYITTIGPDIKYRNIIINYNEYYIDLIKSKIIELVDSKTELVELVIWNGVNSIYIRYNPTFYYPWSYSGNKGINWSHVKHLDELINTFNNSTFNIYSFVLTMEQWKLK